MTKVVISLTISLFFLALLPGQSEARTLEGGIQHVQAMPSIQEDFRKGNRLDASIFSNLDQTNHWVKIPNWMSGTWLVREEVAIFRKNFKTGHQTKEPHKFKAHQKFIYGMQMDRQGAVWHYVGVPYKSQTRMSRFFEIHYVKEKVYDQYKSDSVQFRSIVNVIRTKRSSNKITDSYQQESITRYVPLEEGTGDIQLTASTKSFDQDGKPLIRADNTARVRKIAKFHEVRFHKKKDMRKLFRQFLINSGRSNLLPF